MIILLILFILAILLVFFESAREMKYVKITKYIIESDKISNDYRIAVISDLHNRIIGKENQFIVDAINEISPDFVIAAGDMINNEKPMRSDNTVALLTTLAEKYKIYCVNGNHEQFLKQKKAGNDYFQIYKNNLKNKGITYLENRKISLDEKTDLTGFDIPTGLYKRFSLNKKLPAGCIKDHVGVSDKSKFNIMITHNPVYFEDYSLWGADLVISGHMHGGIIRLPYFGGVISPQCVFFPPYDAGVFRDFNSTMVVSRGAGSHTLNIRVSNYPEIVELEIHKRRK